MHYKKPFETYIFLKIFLSSSMPSFYLEISNCVSSLFSYLLSPLSWYVLKYFSGRVPIRSTLTMLNLYMLLLPEDYWNLLWKLLETTMNQNNMNQIIINTVYLKEQNCCLVFFFQSCQMLSLRDFAC